MTSDADAGNRLRELCRFGKSRAIGHQCGGGHDTTRMRVNDRAIHAGGEAKVIRVDDQAPHCGSLAGKSERYTGTDCRVSEERSAPGFFWGSAVDRFFAAHVYSSKRSSREILLIRFPTDAATCRANIRGAVNSPGSSAHLTSRIPYSKS